MILYNENKFWKVLNFHRYLMLLIIMLSCLGRISAHFSNWSPRPCVPLQRSDAVVRESSHTSSVHMSDIIL